jgi:hypothetical protein
MEICNSFHARQFSFAENISQSLCGSMGQMSETLRRRIHQPDFTFFRNGTPFSEQLYLGQSGMDSFLVIWVAVAPIILVLRIYFLGRKMSEPEKMLRPIKGGLNLFQLQTIARHRQWLASVNLEFHAAFQFGSIQTVVFTQAGKPRSLAMLFHKSVTFCAESQMEDLTLLETSNSGNSGMFPRPGAYAQSFPGIAVQEIWQRHLEGEAYLTQKFGYDWKPLSQPYMDYLAPAMRLRMRHNRAQFLWPFRVLYRFFWTRFRIRNRTIAQQFP